MEANAKGSDLFPLSVNWSFGIKEPFGPLVATDAKAEGNTAWDFTLESSMRALCAGACLYGLVAPYMGAPGHARTALVVANSGAPVTLRPLERRIDRARLPCSMTRAPFEGALNRPLYQHPPTP